MGWSKRAVVLKNGEQEARKSKIAIGDCIKRPRKRVRRMEKKSNR